MFFNIEILSIVFKEYDLNVVFSCRGMTTDEIKSVSPDVKLMDSQLGDCKKTRDQICKEIKSRDDFKLIPVFLISAEINLKELADDCKADGYLAKPFAVINLRTISRDKLA